MEKSIYYGTRMKQVMYRTESRVRFRLRLRSRARKIGPLLRYERATSIGQNEDPMELAPVVLAAKDHQFFSFKRMVRASDGDRFRQVLVMGSVSWGRSTTSTTSSCYGPFGNT